MLHHCSVLFDNLGLHPQLHQHGLTLKNGAANQLYAPSEVRREEFRGEDVRHGEGAARAHPAEHEHDEDGRRDVLRDESQGDATGAQAGQQEGNELALPAK